MKKILYLLAAASIVACVSCKKKNQPEEQPDLTLPTVTWGIEGDTAEIGTKESTKVTVTAENGIDELTVEVTLPSVMMAALLNNTAISLDANYADENSNGKLDLVRDSKSAGFFSLSSVQDAKTVTFNPATLVSELRSGVKTMKDGDTFTFNIYVKDKKENDARLVVKFHWTATPSLEWSAGDLAKPCSFAKNADAASIPSDFSVAAPGKIETFVIKLTAADNIVNLLADNLSVASSLGTVELDLINNSLISDFIDDKTVGDVLKQATNANLNLGKLLNWCAKRINDASANQIKLEFVISDALGRTENFVVNYEVTLE